MGAMRRDWVPCPSLSIAAEHAILEGMYASFFGLEARAFLHRTRPRYLFMSERHRKPWRICSTGRAGGGFVLLMR